MRLGISQLSSLNLQLGSMSTNYSSMEHSLLMSHSLTERISSEVAMYLRFLMMEKSNSR